MSPLTKYGETSLCASLRLSHLYRLSRFHGPPARQSLLNLKRSIGKVAVAVLQEPCSAPGTSIRRLSHSFLHFTFLSGPNFPGLFWTIQSSRWTRSILHSSLLS